MDVHDARIVEIASLRSFPKGPTPTPCRSTQEADPTRGRRPRPDRQGRPDPHGVLHAGVGQAGLPRPGLLPASELGRMRVTDLRTSLRENRDSGVTRAVIGPGPEDEPDDRHRPVFGPIIGLTFTASFGLLGTSTREPGPEGSHTRPRQAGGHRLPCDCADGLRRRFVVPSSCSTPARPGKSPSW